MEYIEIINKLVGSIEPIGKSEVDDKRFENLKVMCELANEIVTQINSIAYVHKNSHEHSVKIMADYADKFSRVTLGIVE